jgi:hypothetical protein
MLSRDRGAFFGFWFFLLAGCAVCSGSIGPCPIMQEEKPIVCAVLIPGTILIVKVPKNGNGVGSIPWQQVRRIDKNRIFLRVFEGCCRAKVSDSNRQSWSEGILGNVPWGLKFTFCRSPEDKITAFLDTKRRAFSCICEIKVHAKWFPYYRFRVGAIGIFSKLCTGYGYIGSVIRNKLLLQQGYGLPCRYCLLVRSRGQGLHSTRLKIQLTNCISDATTDIGRTPRKAIGGIINSISGVQQPLRLLGCTRVVGTGNEELEQSERGYRDSEQQFDVAIRTLVQQLSKILAASLVFVAGFFSMGVAVLIWLTLLGGVRRNNILWFGLSLICVALSAYILHWGIVLGLYS